MRPPRSPRRTARISCLWPRRRPPYLTGPEQGSWLARLDADQANLRRAAEYAASRPDGTALVLRLGVALEAYWWARARRREAFGLLVPVLRRPDARRRPRAVRGGAGHRCARRLLH